MEEYDRWEMKNNFLKRSIVIGANLNTEKGNM